MSHALRHEPELYGLKLEKEGWVPVSHLLEAIRKKEAVFKEITIRDIEQVVNSSKKKRHEIRGEWIRALYGHSTDINLGYEPQKPPTVLYHGTTLDRLDRILAAGLKPMGRQFVHLSTNKQEATLVAKRRSKEVVILEILASKAYEAGVKFYFSDSVWLCYHIPPDCIISL